MREPAPRVTLVRRRTVENVDSIGIRGPQMDPVLGREVEECQQLLLIVGDSGVPSRPVLRTPALLDDLSIDPSGRYASFRQGDPQVLSILYFGATWDSGLARAVLASVIALVLGLLVGALGTRAYDLKGLTRKYSAPAAAAQ